MMYNSFAAIYDKLMVDVPYNKWVQFLEEKRSLYNITGRQILDIGCGTGELLIKLAKQNYDVVGVDKSVEMLAIANQKIIAANLAVPLFQQDMSMLDSLGKFDIVTVFCDSLNYLRDEVAVEQTFTRIYEHLKQGGMLLFDVHSVYKFEQIFYNKTFAINDEEISYIWQSFPGDDQFSVEHDLTFFVFNKENQSYARFDEFHYQRTFSIEKYEQMLKNCNFELLEISADFTDQPPKATSERLFFVAIKN